MTSAESSGGRRAGLVGIGLVLVYCLINSSKSVLEASLVQRMSPEFLAFHVFLLAQVVFLVLCRDRRGMVTLARRRLPDVLGFNVSTTVSWVAVLYAFTVLEPAVANSVIIGLVPSMTILLGRWMRPGTTILPLERVAAAGVFAGMLYLAAIAFAGVSATGRVSVLGVTGGLVACVATATAVAGNTYYTKRLSEAGMTVGQMMACRFVLLLVVTLAIMLARHSTSPYTPRTVGVLVLIGVVGVIVSLYVLQLGIVRTEPITVSMLFGVNLVITYLVQFADPRLHQSAGTFVGVALVCGFMSLGTWARYRRTAGPPTDPPAGPAPADEDRDRAESSSRPDTAVRPSSAPLPGGTP